MASNAGVPGSPSPAGHGHASPLEVEALTALSYESRLRNPAEGLAAAERALSLAESSHSAKGVADSQCVLGICTLLLFDFKRSREALHAALDGYRVLGDTAGEARALQWLGFYHLQRGDCAAAIEAELRSVERFEGVNDLNGEATSINFLGWVFFSLFRLAEAWQCWCESERIFRRLSDPIGLSHSFVNLGALYYHLGRVPDAYSYFRRSLQLKESAGDLWNSPGVLMNMGHCKASLNKPFEAHALFERALSTARSVESRRGEARALVALAELRPHAGAAGDAERLTRDAFAIGSTCGAPDVEAEVYLCLGKCFLEQGDNHAAIHHLRVGSERPGCSFTH